MKSKTLNLPNVLTLFRVLLVPFIIAAMLIDVEWFDWLALGLYLLATVTDFIDGQIARKYNLITNFGKLMDPLADKMVVISVLLVLLAQNRINVIPIIIIVVREIAVTGLRAVVASSTKGALVIPASIFGKIKTFSQMVTVFVLLINSRIAAVTSFPIADILVVIMTVFTVISGAEYFYKAKDCLKD